MKPWKVTVVDGKFGREQGFAIVLAGTSEEAADATRKYLRNDSAYGVPHVIARVDEHLHAEPLVVVMNWGDWPGGWPPDSDTPDAVT